MACNENDPHLLGMQSNCDPNHQAVARFELSDHPTELFRC